MKKWAKSSTGFVWMIVSTRKERLDEAEGSRQELTARLQCGEDEYAS